MGFILVVKEMAPASELTGAIEEEATEVVAPLRAIRLQDAALCCSKDTEQQDLQ